MKTRSTFVTGALLCLTAGNGLAQEKLHVSFKVSAENSKYTQQQNIDVRDVPNHVVRIYELHRTFPNTNAPVINGLRIVEEWDTGTADRIGGNGSDIGYSVFVMENGDKCFARYGGHVQTNSGRSTDTLSGPITGCTGKLLGIQGIVQTVVNFDPAAGFNESQVNIDYSIGK